MLKLIEAILAFIFDPEARQKAPISFHNGAGMSVREAKLYGLYYRGQFVTQDYLAQLADIARDGSDNDKALFLALRWNWANRGLPVVNYLKSELEGNVPVQVVGPAFSRGGYAFITLETIGEVLLSRVESLEKYWGSKRVKFFMKTED